jgi:copper chaperone CopZ
MQTEAVAMEVAKALESVSGVDRVYITLAHTRARIGFDETLASAQQLRGAVQAAGFLVADDAGGGHSCCGGCGG